MGFRSNFELGQLKDEYIAGVFVRGYIAETDCIITILLCLGNNFYIPFLHPRGFARFYRWSGPAHRLPPE